MKWTQQNKQAYLMIKFIQVLISGGFLAFSFHTWQRLNETQPDHPLMFALKFSMGMMAADIFTFFLDFVMVIRRLKVLISLRFIVCVLAFTLGVMVQVDFVEYIRRNDAMSLDLSDTFVKYNIGVITYIYEYYLVWVVLNTIMYFQIKNMEKQEAKQKKDLLKNLEDLKRNANVEF